MRIGKAREVGKGRSRDYDHCGQWRVRQKKREQFFLSVFIVKGRRESRSVFQSLFHSWPCLWTLVLPSAILPILSRCKKALEDDEEGEGWWQEMEKNRKCVQLGQIRTYQEVREKNRGLEGGGFIIDRPNLRKIYDFLSLLLSPLSIHPLSSYPEGTWIREGGENEELIYSAYCTQRTTWVQTSSFFLACNFGTSRREKVFGQVLRKLALQISILSPLKSPFRTSTWGIHNPTSPTLK